MSTDRKASTAPNATALAGAERLLGTQAGGDVAVTPVQLATFINAVEDGATAGGDLSGFYPNPSVVNDSHSHTVATLPAAMPPTAHATLHENGGVQEINVDGLAGVLADPQTPAAHVHAAADITSGTIATARLGTGTADETTFLRGDRTYAVPGGNAGDVFGPAGSTDNGFVRFDGTTGKLVQDGPVTQSDAGAVAGITQLDVDNLRFDANTISSLNTNGDVLVAPNGTGVLGLPAATPAAPNRVGTLAGVAEEPGVGLALVAIGSKYIRFWVNGTARWHISPSNQAFENAAGTGGNVSISNATSTATLPVYTFISDLDTGVGRAGADQLSTIAGGAEISRAEFSAGSARIGFLGKVAAPATAQTGGAATAGAAYTAAEQVMLQAAYDCLRAFGFLT